MFRTELHVKPSEWKIDHHKSVFSIGSCFAVHIGHKLSEYKIPSMVNPFGTIFNPISVFDLMELCLEDKFFPEWSFLQNQGVYRNYLLHSDISALRQKDLEQKIIGTTQSVKEFLERTDILMITFGTAIIYELKTNAQQVANCHKMPSDIFNKRMLSLEEITKSFEQLLGKLLKINPDLKIILTVSPVRHIKDTLELNNVSKSILRIAAESIVSEYPNVTYFPSFELMMDDLRDYRFYADDMLHPNKQAIEYIWSKFQQCFFEKETQDFVKKWDKILSAIAHRPFNPESSEHQKFLMKTLGQLDQFKSTVDISKEVEILKKQLHD